MKPPQAPTISAATWSYKGKPNKTYTFAVTAIGSNGKRGTTANIGPVVGLSGSGGTVQEAAPLK